MVNRIVCVNVCECRSELCVCVVNLGGGGGMLQYVFSVSVGFKRMKACVSECLGCWVWRM